MEINRTENEQKIFDNLKKLLNYAVPQKIEKG